MHQALYQKTQEEQVRCFLCPHLCLLAEDEVGKCGVRVVKSGILYTINYGCLAAAGIDPIEKKPLYHFYPGSDILSLGTIGCNLSCSFCQNWSIARGDEALCRQRITPQAVFEMLKNNAGARLLPGVAYTYNEPLIWYEFVLETAKLLNKKGCFNVLVTNGFINPGPLRELLPFIDAMNIDVKGFSDQFYRRYCGGTKNAVLKTVEKAAASTHVEVTCLLIPSLNDSEQEQEELAKWLSSISPDIVLHYSRYFPSYQADFPPTPIETIRRSLEIAKKYLRYVYPGNINIAGGADTLCPYCGNLLISRLDYQTKVVGLDGAKCNNCHQKIALVMPES